MNIKDGGNIKLQHCKCARSAVSPSDEVKIDLLSLRFSNAIKLRNCIRKRAFVVAASTTVRHASVELFNTFATTLRNGIGVSVYRRQMRLLSDVSSRAAPGFLCLWNFKFNFFPLRMLTKTLLLSRS